MKTPVSVTVTGSTVDIIEEGAEYSFLTFEALCYGVANSYKHPEHKVFADVHFDDGDKYSVCLELFDKCLGFEDYVKSQQEYFNSAAGQNFLEENPLRAKAAELWEEYKWQEVL